MNDASTDIYIKNQFQLKIMKRVAAWFDDKDDCENWFFYQKLSHFHGMTAEEVLLELGASGYNALVEYADKKEHQKL